MSQDIISDGLNQMMNALRARKSSVVIKKTSKIFSSILAIAKLKGYIKEYKLTNNELKVEFEKLNKCQAIKPRYMVSVDEIGKFVKRYLPAKNFGIIIISTSKGLMTHQTAIEKNIGGCLVAYMY